MKVYIVESYSYDEYERVAVCASLELAAQVLKDEAEDEAEQLTNMVPVISPGTKMGLGSSQIVRDIKSRKRRYYNDSIHY